MVALIGNRKAVSFGNPTTGNPSLGDAFTLLAKPYLDTLTPAIKRQSLFDAERKAAGVASVDEAIQAAKTSGGLPNIYDLASGGVRGGMTGANVGDYNLLLASGVKGAQSREATDAAFGSGKNYGSTYHGTQDQLQNARTLQAMQEATKLKVEAQKPQTVLVNGVPTVVRQSESYGQPASVGMAEQQGALLRDNWDRLPDLGEEQKKAIGALPPTERTLNYVAPNPAGGVSRGRTVDGRTDMTTGQPLPASAQVVSPTNQGGTGPFTPDATDSRGLRARLQANKEVVDLADRIRNIVSNDATVVGPTGNVRRLSQNAVDTLNNVGTLFGDPERFTGALAQTQSEAVSKGVNPSVIMGLFDPNASNIVKMNSLLLYKAAAALAGQSGREVSDKDIIHLTSIVGDPASWLEGSQQYLNGIKFVRDIAAQGAQNAEQALAAGDVRGTPSASSETPSAQGPSPDGVLRWERGPDGRPRRVQ